MKTPVIKFMAKLAVLVLLLGCFFLVEAFILGNLSLLGCLALALPCFLAARQLFLALAAKPKAKQPRPVRVQPSNSPMPRRPISAFDMQRSVYPPVSPAGNHPTRAA